jgi:hypothetical protein
MAAGKTYEPIATTTVSSATNSVSFSSISGAYTDLVIVASVQSSATDTLLLRCGNGSVDTGSNYSITVLKGNGSSATSARTSSAGNFYVDYAAYAPSSASTFSSLIIQFNNYSNTTTYKTMLSRANNAAVGVDAIVGLWRSTSAINTLEFKYSPGTNIASGSTFTLYGIAAA